MCGATVVGTDLGRVEGLGGRAELAMRGGLWGVDVDGGAVTAGAVEVVGPEVGAANWDGVGEMASLSPPVDVAMYSDPRITVSARSEMFRAEARRPVGCVRACRGAGWRRAVSRSVRRRARACCARTGLIFATVRA